MSVARLGVVGFILVISGSAGCSTEPCELVGNCRVGDACGSPQHCETGVCVVGYSDANGESDSACSTTCESGTCAAGLVCATLSGSQVCVPPCSDGYYFDYPVVGGFGDVFCELGVPHDCNTLLDHPAANCAPCENFSSLTESVCGPGNFCDVTEGGSNRCEPLHSVGERCNDHRDCTSGNCAYIGLSGEEPLAGTCLAAHGSSCTASNCTSCGTADFTSFCHQECRTSEECPASHPGCFGIREEGRYWCRATCSRFASTCPSGYRCIVTTDFFTDICVPE